MKIPREVVLDLLPLYLAGETSPVTQAFIDDCLKENPELAEKFQSLKLRELSSETPQIPRPDLELKTLRKVRRILALRRWLFGFSIGFTAILFSLDFTIAGGKLTGVHLYLLRFPVIFGVFLVLAVGCWTGYALLKRHLST